MPPGGSGSHPSRVRGLKLVGNHESPPPQASHPSRVRGLKRCRSWWTLGSTLWSHPSRVRGLKPLAPGCVIKDHKSHPSRVRGLKQRGWRLYRLRSRSHPSRVRGLKRGKFSAACGANLVAPLAGAWIEMNTRTAPGWTRMSHPSRVRGLKYEGDIIKVNYTVSHPSRVRGLKSV